MHFDGSAFHTVLSTLSGYKLVLIGCPISDTEPTPPNLKHGDPFILMKNDRVIVYLVVLRPTIDMLWVSFSTFLNWAANVAILQDHATTIVSFRGHR